MSRLRFLFDGAAVATVSVDSDLGKTHFRNVSPDARFLSEKQFRVFRQGGGWMLEHVSSATNETLCNGERVAGSMALCNGMTIAVGNSAKGVSKFPLLVDIEAMPDESEILPTRPPSREVPVSEVALPSHDEIVHETTVSEESSSIDWAGAAAVALDVFGTIMGGAAGGRTVVHQGRSTMSPIVLTIEDNRVYCGNGTFGDVVAVIENGKIYRGRSTMFGEVLAHVDGDRVIAGNSSWGDVIARIDGTRVIAGTSTWGDVIATVENGGYMAAGAAAAYFLLM